MALTPQQTALLQASMSGVEKTIKKLHKEGVSPDVLVRTAKDSMEAIARRATAPVHEARAGNKATPTEPTTRPGMGRKNG